LNLYRAPRLPPALQKISPPAVPSSPCRRMKAICASVNFDLFMVLPRPTARIAHASKLEFSSNDRSENREAGQSSLLLIPGRGEGGSGKGAQNSSAPLCYA